MIRYIIISIIEIYYIISIGMVLHPLLRTYLYFLRCDKLILIERERESGYYILGIRNSVLEDGHA